ncbi:MAG TPA: tripartite tricarboxylate transporter substrate binding protein [Burkholderiales bacterium]|jgi:tripartite-type tricarboxylate transporter receptor subunit TctC|nr:tripartite tricarboxylate transporter substrate binding protein [Burkholderiales bacterium]
MRNTNYRRTQQKIAIALVVATTLAATTSLAQNYPAKPIRLVVPFTPGGSTDLVARIVAQKLEQAWGQQVIVENRPGAGGNIGVDYVAKSAPDGYTLIFGHIGTFGFGPSFYPKLPYDPIRDFAPIILYAMVPNMLVVHPSLPAKSVRELIALAKARPGQLNYGSSGSGSASHLAVEYFKLLSKTDITAIAYRGTGPMVIDLIAGQISLTITGVPPLYPQVKAGRLRGIAVASAKRLTLLPELPSIAEAGVPGYESTTWFGPLAPAKTPKDIIVKINTQLMQTLQSPDVRERFAAEGIEALGGTPDQFAEYIRSEIARWGRVIKEAGVRPE